MITFTTRQNIMLLFHRRALDGRPMTAVNCTSNLKFCIVCCGIHFFFEIINIVFFFDVIEEIVLSLVSV